MKEILLKIWNFIKILYGVCFSIAGVIIFIFSLTDEELSIGAGFIIGLIFFFFAFLCFKKKGQKENLEKKDISKVESNSEVISKKEIDDRKFCPICGEKLSFLSKIKVVDGFVCGYCASVTESSITRTKSEIQSYWNTNNERVKIFNPSQVLKSFGNEQISIDYEHKFFAFGNIKKMVNPPKIYTFDEVVSFEYKVVKQKTTIEKKGGVGRAIVGNMIAGPVGAIVGSNTAKQNVKTEETKLFYIYINSFAGKNTITMSYPPAGLESFLNDCISLSQVKETSINNVDEILKYKQLLDTGIITQEDFEKKKKELLSL